MDSTVQKTENIVRNVRRLGGPIKVSVSGHWVGGRARDNSFFITGVKNSATIKPRDIISQEEVELLISRGVQVEAKDQP